MNIDNNRLVLEQAVPGMTLASVLLDAKGDVLLPQGTILTEPMLASLRRRGIETLPVMVEQQAPVRSEAELQAERMRLHQRLDKLFRKCGTEDASGLLRGYLMLHRTGRLP